MKLKILGATLFILIVVGIAHYHFSGTAEGDVGYSLVVDIHGWDYGPHCQLGLQTVSYSVVTDDHACSETSDSFVCTRCGNGVCGKGENFCNCPVDCK